MASYSHLVHMLYIYLTVIGRMLGPGSRYVGYIYTYIGRSLCSNDILLFNRYIDRQKLAPCLKSGRNLDTAATKIILQSTPSSNIWVYALSTAIHTNTAMCIPHVINNFFMILR
jgi:hypothetical protein